MPGVNHNGLLRSPRDIKSESTRHSTPTSLLTISIQYVSQHLELVESLVGFPEIVGELIFRAAESSCKFYYQDDEYHDCLKRLKLFTQAYKEVVLSKLSLNGRWSSLQLYKDHIQIFRDLTDLELAECGLDDADELLPHIGQHLLHLKCLSLRQNKLSDKGLVRLTTPYRVMGVGPRNLTLLNISDNQEITGTGVLKYLSAFQHLDEINVTGTTVKRSEAMLKTWRFDIKKGNSTGVEITSCGWASDVVNKWASQAEESLLLADNEKTTAQRFYSNKRINELKSSKLKGTFKKTVSGYHIILTRIREDVTKDVSPGHKLLRKDGNKLVQRTYQHSAKLGHFSDELSCCGDTKLTKSDTSYTERFHGDSERHDFEMMRGYQINTCEQNQQVIREKSELHIAKRRKINICKQQIKADDYNDSEYNGTDNEHLLKGTNEESFKTDLKIAPLARAQTSSEEMAKNDLQLMMGYMGTKTGTTGIEKKLVRHGIFMDDLAGKQDTKMSFFDKGEAELMKGCAKDSFRSLKRKKSFWKHINDNIPQ